MKINIQSLSFHPSDQLIEFTENKISKLSHYNDMIMEAQVTLKVDRSDTKNNKVCEIRLAVPGNDLYAGKRCHSFEEAILRTSEALKQRLRHWKKKYQKTSLNQNNIPQES